MYQDFFQLSELPFSIVPNPKFYYLSEHHKEALRHVLRGIEDGGGLALLTGEVGTGKTTTLRQLLERLPKTSQVITILNPSITVLELMTTLCQELGIEYRESDTFKNLYDAIAKKLFSNEENGIKTILLVDEAQHVTPDVLEQLRLLTNIETMQRKLLKVILIGQPELQQMLRQPNLRQLAQRITARYHLVPLPMKDVKNYILHRLNCAGRLGPLFSDAAISVIALKSAGVPRLINLVCDQALKITYRESKQRVSRKVALRACRDVLDWQDRRPGAKEKTYLPLWVLSGGVVVAVSLALWLGKGSLLPFISSFATENTQSLFVKEPVVKEPVVKELETALEQVNEPVKLPETVELVPLADLAQEGLSFGSAIQNLYQQWGFEADIMSASCSSQVRGNLACSKIKMPLFSLLAMRRPMVLKFNSPSGQSWFAVLLGAGNALFELQVGQTRVLVSKRFFEQLWSDEAFILWTPPFGDPSSIKMGQSGKRVIWINERLDTVLEAEKSTFNQFGLKLRLKVQDFQRKKGLTADGVPGAMTLMLLDISPLMFGPTLRDPIDVSTAQETLLSGGDAVLLPNDTLLNLALVPLPANETKADLKEERQKQKEKDEGEVWVLNTDTATVSVKKESANEAKDKDTFSLLDLDLSTLSPQLAKRIKSAFSTDEDKKTSKPTDAKTPFLGSDNAIAIADLSSAILARLPAMNFQMHIYASNAASRWIKVNGKEIKEGEFLAKGVQLKGVEPQLVVVEFEGDLISIPALTEW